MYTFCMDSQPIFQTMQILKNLEPFRRDQACCPIFWEVASQNGNPSAHWIVTLMDDGQLHGWKFNGTMNAQNRVAIVDRIFRESADMPNGFLPGNPKSALSFGMENGGTIEYLRKNDLWNFLNQSAPKAYKIFFNIAQMPRRDRKELYNNLECRNVMDIKDVDVPAPANVTSAEMRSLFAPQDPKQYRGGKTPEEKIGQFIITGWIAVPAIICAAQILYAAGRKLAGNFVLECGIQAAQILTAATMGALAYKAVYVSDRAIMRATDAKYGLLPTGGVESYRDYVGNRTAPLDKYVGRRWQKFGVMATAFVLAALSTAYNTAGWLREKIQNHIVPSPPPVYIYPTYPSAPNVTPPEKFNGGIVKTPSISPAPAPGATIDFSTLAAFRQMSGRGRVA